jgi:hypothetical protein
MVVGVLHLGELLECYPTLRRVTGDALYVQRNLAELILESGHDLVSIQSQPN